MGGLRGTMGYEIYLVHLYEHDNLVDGCPFCHPWPVVGVHIPDQPWPLLDTIELQGKKTRYPMASPQLPAHSPPDGTGGPDPA